MDWAGGQAGPLSGILWALPTLHMFRWLLADVVYANMTIVLSTKRVDDCLVISAVTLPFLSHLLD